MQQCKLSRHMEEDRSVGQAFVETQRPLHICHVQSKTNQGNGHNHFSSVSTLRSSSASAATGASIGTGAAEFWFKRRYDFNVGRGSGARPAGNALERIWNDEWERHIVNAALEKVQQQCSAN